MTAHSELHIGGASVQVESRDVIELVNPATEQIIATVPAAGCGNGCELGRAGLDEFLENQSDPDARMTRARNDDTPSETAPPGGH